MTLLDNGKFAGRTSGDWLATAVGETGIFGAGVDMVVVPRLLLMR